MTAFHRHLGRSVRGLALLLLATLAGAVVFLLADRLRPLPPPLKLASNQWLGYEPLFLAQDAGSLNPKLVRLASLPSTTEVIRALQHGVADAATLTLDETLSLAAAGLPLTVVAVADVSAGADAVLLRSDLPDGAPLRGLRIGYEGTAVGAYVLSRFLQHNGIDLSSVSLSVVPPDNHAEALRTHTLDAVVTYEPFITQMTGLARPVFTSAAIPGEVVDVLVVRTDLLRPEVTAHLRQVWLDGVSRLLSGDPARLDGTGRRHGLTPAMLRQALEGIRFPAATDQAAYLNGTVPALGRQASALWAAMENTRLIPAGARFPALPFAPWPLPPAPTPQTGAAQ